ncbi:acyltransferase [Mesorhizobium dulcispinae]|uniref:acyltransferase n=1 Tax=Mesorhizobium dulcispinae TaxID=3072316 RepID=UPI002A23B787|nr:acyltransferase [Mesorhizobium sp. VK23D]MDX8521143.1 acyltransferase [Mesorhizobium sp. VK23D]
MSLKEPSRLCVILTILLFTTAASNAGESAASLVAAGLNILCAPFGARVSASEGNFRSNSPKYHCLGAFQFCPGTFEIYYSRSAAQFLASPSDQVVAWTRYERVQWQLAVKYKLTELVGTEVCVGTNNCKKIDASAILMACQFGCGNKGKLSNYRQGRDCDARNVKDGNLVSVCTYLYKGAGYNVSCFTGVSNDNADQPKPTSAGSDHTTQPKPTSEDCSSPSASAGSGRMELVVNNITFRFDESASTDTVAKIFQLIRGAN